MSDDPLLDALNGAVDENRTWQTNAMAKLTVRVNGQYKKAAVAAGDPVLFFTDVYAGKKANYIFVFEPVDSRPYDRIEMDEKQVFEMLPGFEEHIVRALGQMPERLNPEGEELEITTIPTYRVASAKFKAERARKIKEREESAAMSAAQIEASRYADNPRWGMF